MSRQESSGESLYPTKEQFACVRCKNKKFTSWNDFENHHAKHAVDFTFSQLPFVKLQRIKIPHLNSQNLKLKHPDSEIQSSISIIDSKDTAASTSDVVPEASAPCENKEPPESQALEEEEMLTWPGSCESSSPLNSPISEIPLSTSSETITTATGEPHGDSNILDPAFIEKLGEEINFLNQNSVDPVPDTVASVPKEPLSEVQLRDENISGSSSASISISDFPVPSLIDISFPEPITPETPPTENATTSVELDKPEDQLEKVVDEKEVSDGEKNESISTPKEAELPKSKGQLRLVPYESLLSPSFLLANSEDDDESVSIKSPISPSKTSNKPQPMVAIPEQNLEDLNIPDRQSTANSVPVKALTEAVSTPQQVLQKSQPTPPPEITVPSVPQTTQTSSAPTQQQRMTQVYPFHGQGNRQPQVNQQLPTQQQSQQPQQQHQQNHPHLQQHLQQQTQLQQLLQQQPQLQQQSQLQQHLQQQTPPIQLLQQQKQQQHLQQQTPQIQHLQQQMQQQQQQQQLQQQQQQLQQQQQQQQLQQQQQQLQQQQQQQQLQQQQQQQQTHFHQQQYPQQQQQHPNLSSMQYQQQQQAYQQIGAGQQQNTYAQTQAPQYIQRFSTPPRTQYPVQSYNASCRAVQPNQSTRATMNSVITLSNSNGTIHVPPVSAYFQQITTNSIPPMAPSNPIQHQLTVQGSYNQVVVHTNNSLPHYSNRPQTSMAQHVQLQVATTRPTVATTQLRPQAITIPSQGIRVASSPALPNSVRLPPPTQQRQAFVAILPHPQSLNSVNIPTTSTTSATTSSTDRLPAPSHQGQTAANAFNRSVSQKRHLVVEGGISGAGQPAHKVARTEETTAVSANVSTAVCAAQQNGDCEVLIVQKKQTGLPVIQSVEGGGSSSTKSSVQSLQTPSVASLLSNPNITITPAKNKENQTGSDSAASKSVNASTNSVINVSRTSRPITVDLTASTDSLPQQRNPLQCQVCNETFNSQSLLKNHLVLHLRKVHTTVARPTSNTYVNRNQGSKQAAVNPPISRASNVNGQTTDIITPSTSGYVTTQTSTTTKQATPAGIRPIDASTGSVNTNQQTKNGATSGQNRSTNEISMVPPSTTSSTQSSCCKEPTAISMEKATSSGSEFYIPIVDLKRLDVISKLESMGINQFIPATNLTSCSGHNNLAIPIMSASALRKSGTTGFPSLCGVVNLGSPKPFSSTLPK